MLSLGQAVLGVPVGAQSSGDSTAGDGSGQDADDGGGGPTDEGSDEAVPVEVGPPPGGLPGRAGEPGPGNDGGGGSAVAGEAGSPPQGFEFPKPGCPPGYVCGASSPLPAPTGLTCASATSNSITFSWDRVTGSTKYSAKIQLAVGGSRQTENTTTGESTTFTGLSPGRKYFIGVLALQGSVVGHWSGANCWTTPVAPILRCGTATSSSIEVKWTEPRGATKYQIWSLDRWITPNGSLSHVWSGLDASKPYWSYVSAGNKGGWSWWGSRRCYTKAAPLPAPTGLMCASATTNSITFSWNGVTGATKYLAKIQLAVVGSRQTENPPTTSERTTFTGLSPGTRYYIGVLALQGTVAGHSNAGYCWTKPAKPVMECGTATSSSIEVTWTAPDGATKYQVWTDSGWIDLSGSLSHVWSGLDSSQTYTRYVRAGNTAGWGPYGSLDCDTTDPPVRLPVPASLALSCSADGKKLSVGWDQVTQQGVTVHYRLQDAAGADLYTGPQSGPSAFVSTSLHNRGKTFTLKVRAERDDGSEPSLWSPAETVSCQHPPPAGLKGHCTATSLTASWKESPSASQHHLRVFTWDDTDDEWVESSDTNLRLDTPGIAGTLQGVPTELFQIRVKATNSLGTTELSDPVEILCDGYLVLDEVYDGVQKAADTAITEALAPANATKRTEWTRCSTLGTSTAARSEMKNRLAALMLTIAALEITGGNKKLASAPMVLSRGDNPAQRSNSLKLFSNMTLDDYERAFWNPGVGPWQLDYFTIVHMNHAERADIAQGGLAVAEFLLHNYCVRDTTLTAELKDKWHACKKSDNACQRAFDDLYNSGLLKVQRVKEFPGAGGSVQRRDCRWGNTGERFPCYLYDMDPYTSGPLKDDHFGYVAEGPPPAMANPSGTVSSTNPNGFTPIARSFISFTYEFRKLTKQQDDQMWEDSTKYAVWPARWPASTNLMSWPTETLATDDPSDTNTIIKPVPMNIWSRYSPPGTVTGISHRLSNRSTSKYGPEGWYENTIAVAPGDSVQRDLQLKSCALDVFDLVTGEWVESCVWVSTNIAESSSA
ncbi:MAG: fibronectin type III domain-containing protein [Acidimicrobiia bacterium]|nr:fibronectin type III domain-containing protein [Acidimicrobiia bacterium]